MQRLETYTANEPRNFAVLAPNGDRIALLQTWALAQQLADVMSESGAPHTVVDVRSL
jgi:hypothetical protein